MYSLLPSDSELAAAFLERKHRLFGENVIVLISLFSLSPRPPSLFFPASWINFGSCLSVLYWILCREGSARGFGIRISQSSPGSDSWVDDPITRHLIGLYINKEREEDKNLLWPLILHVRGHYNVLVLPLVEPRHLKAYAKLCKRPVCGNALGEDDSLSSLLLDLPSITGYGKLLANYTNIEEVYQTI